MTMLRRCIRRSAARYMENALFGGPAGREVKSRKWTATDEVNLERRIRARVMREKAAGTYDYYDPDRPPAVKANGGLRGSTATRWR